MKDLFRKFRTGNLFQNDLTNVSIEVKHVSWCLGTRRIPRPGWYVMVVKLY